MKKGIQLFSIVLIISFLGSCKKETPTMISPFDPCAQNYELYSKPYENIFKGDYNKGCPVTAQAVYPDKYSYRTLGVNPKNKYEICFLRQLNDTRGYDLLKYNFCTNKTNLIASKVKTASDWSSQDYFIFVSETDDKVYRIKSNGDSLKQLTNIAQFYLFCQWSPDGNKIMLDSQTFIDANGNKLPKLPVSFYTYAYQWESDSTLFHSSGGLPKDDFKLYRYNFNTKISQLIYTAPKNGVAFIYHYSAKNLKIYGSIQDGSKYNYFSLDTKTLERKSLGTYENAFAHYVAGSFDNHLLATFNMRDTVPNQICKFKHRNHIALMNFDGTNERQVLIPE